ncbi:MAG: lysophospholipid acyltransferase family protein [Planctomycetota bacterium]
MLDFCDQPFRYFPPKYSRLWAPLLRLHNRLRYLPKAKRVASVEPVHHEPLMRELQPRDRLLLLPNHPTHADAAILIEALGQLDLRSLVMAAYDPFLNSGPLHRFAMQRLGAFSVDRDASRPEPMKRALDTLRTGDFALTVFPEGNVYLTNDRVTPFLDGAAFLALKAQQELLAGDNRGRVLAVPISIKATHRTNARMRIAQRFAPLARQLDVDADFMADPADAIYTAAETALHRNLKQRGLDIPDAPDLPTLADHAARNVVEALEAKLDLTPKPGDTVLDRVRAARRVIHEVRVDPDRSVDHAAATTWADEAMLAFRIASYPTGYARDRPTVDRIGETVEKLEEDLLGRLPRPFADRHAWVRFNPPLDLRDYLSGGTKLRAAMRNLTADAEASVQAGLDQLNLENPHPGGQDW